MKASVQPLAESAALDKSWVAVFADLVKARLTFLVLLTTLVGFYLGYQGSIDFLLMFHTIVGTALVAGGASALNQLIERDHDRKMRRTENRPLPSGRLRAETVLIFGTLCSAVGVLYLGWGVNWLTALLGLVTWGSYLFIYTPLKRITTLNTAIGAIPGALPPLMGWTAACGRVTVEGWVLVAILFFWQLPHFLAIAWIYRDEYAKAGFAMLPVLDPDGVRTGRHALSHTLGLLPISLAPFLLHLTGRLYLFGALLLGVVFLWCAFQFARHLSLPRARLLFFVSILYLPLLLILMVLNKIK